MSDIRRMEYDQANEMIRILDNASTTLNNAVDAMNTLASNLDNGWLVGMGGVAFSDALRGKFAPAIERLSDELKRQAKFVEVEMIDMMEAERRASNLFGK